MNPKISSHFQQTLEVESFYRVNKDFVNGIWISFFNKWMWHPTFGAIRDFGLLYCVVIVNLKEKLSRNIYVLLDKDRPTE